MRTSGSRRVSDLSLFEDENKVFEGVKVKQVFIFERGGGILFYFFLLFFFFFYVQDDTFQPLIKRSVSDRLGKNFPQLHATLLRIFAISRNFVPHTRVAS